MVPFGRLNRWVLGLPQGTVAPYKDCSSEIPRLLGVPKKGCVKLLHAVLDGACEDIR